MKSLLARFGPLLGLLVVWGLFALLRPTEFLDLQNQRLMLVQTAVVGTAAIGATYIIMAGGIDLSVGSTIALGTMLVAMGLQAGLSPWLAALLAVVGALYCGLCIGLMVVGQLVAAVLLLLAAGLLAWSPSVWFAAIPLFALVALLLARGRAGAGRVNPGKSNSLLGLLTTEYPLTPFIVTLGMWGALRGAAKGLGNNQPIYPSELGWLRGLMIPSAEGGFLNWLPPGVWLLFGLSALAAWVLKATVFGRHCVAIGSSEETARLCGVRVQRTKLLIYSFGIGCAGLAALLQFSYLSIGDPTTAEGYELKVIAAVVIGGASLSGGEGSILGTLVGALIMTVVDNGCTKLGLDNWVQELATGAIIVLAVFLDRLRHSASSK